MATPESAAPEPELKAIVENYLEAFEARDLDRCLAFFTENATIHFAFSTYRGRQQVEEWHRDRFAAEVRILRVEDVRREGDAIVVDAVATSRVVQAWRFSAVAGTGTFVLDRGKIADARFGLRLSLPQEGW